MRSRLRRLAAVALLAALAAAAGVSLSRAGFGVPCLFHLVTGLECPGCGTTRMFSALAAGNFAAAWRCNAGLMLCLPLLGVLAVWLGVDFVRTGSLRPNAAQNTLLWACVVFLLLFGVLRNLPLYPYRL